MTATLAALKTILVADDTAFVRDRFRLAIETAGHRALTAGTADELVAALRSQGTDIDLIVLDLRLPRGRGVSLLRTIRTVDQRQRPVLVFSGTIASTVEARELAGLGVAGYVNEYAAAQHILPALAPHLFPDRYRRRASPRVVLGVTVTYRFGNTIATAVTLNVSAGGLAVRTSSPLARGTAARVRFRLPRAAKSIDAPARVCWSESGIGMGLQFTSMTPVEQSVVDDFVGSHFFSNRKA